MVARHSRVPAVNSSTLNEPEVLEVIWRGCGADQKEGNLREVPKAAEASKQRHGHGHGGAGKDSSPLAWISAFTL